MTVRQPRYSKEEFARRGDKIYESQGRSQVEEGNHGKIDTQDAIVDTGIAFTASKPNCPVKPERKKARHNEN